MPAVNFRLRWPDGREREAYSPSTVIYQYLKTEQSYSLADFMQRADAGLRAASERVRQVRGFSCSSAMECLMDLQSDAARYDSGDVRVIEMYEHSSH